MWMQHPRTVDTADYGFTIDVCRLHLVLWHLSSFWIVSRVGESVTDGPVIFIKYLSQTYLMLISDRLQFCLGSIFQFIRYKTLVLSNDYCESHQTHYFIGKTEYWLHEVVYFGFPKPTLKDNRRWIKLPLVYPTTIIGCLTNMLPTCLYSVHSDNGSSSIRDELKPFSAVIALTLALR